MKLLETSYLVDFEKRRDVAKTFYQAHKHESLAASTISMFELAFGVVWESNRDLQDLQESLLWVDFLDFSTRDALEAAQIQAELQAEGERIPIGDILIAGVARNRGATLVAADEHFDGIDGLTVQSYRTGE